MEFWSLSQAAVWIEFHTTRRCSISSATVERLEKALRSGAIKEATGCIDGGKRQAISTEHWYEYRLQLKHFIKGAIDRQASTITVLSIHWFPAAMVNFREYPSDKPMIDNSPGYHRAILNVLIPTEAVKRLWPPPDGEPAVPADSAPVAAEPPPEPHSVPTTVRRPPGRRRPSADPVTAVLQELYPQGIPDLESNMVLIDRVGKMLKELNHKVPSKDTILRAADRRKR